MALVEILEEIEIFADFTETQLELIASICTEESHNAGDILFAENTVGDGLYVIISGEIDIQVDPAMVSNAEPGQQMVTIATLRSKQSLGEVALVDQGLRSASARVSKHDTHLAFVPREKLMLLCDSYPQLGYKLMRNLAADLAMKIRNTDLRVRDQLTWGTNKALG